MSSADALESVVGVLAEAVSTTGATTGAGVSTTGAGVSTAGAVAMVGVCLLRCFERLPRSATAMLSLIPMSSLPALGPHDFGRSHGC